MTSTTVDPQIDELVRQLSKSTVHDSHGEQITLKDLDNEGFRGVLTSLRDQLRDQLYHEFEASYKEETSAAHEQTEFQQKTLADIQNRNRELEQQLQDQQSHHTADYQSLRGEFEVLRREVTQPTATTAKPNYQRLLGKPPPFSGAKRGQETVNAFLVSLNSIFAFEKGLTDTEKILMSTTHFEADKPAFHWISPYMHYLHTDVSNGPAFLHSWQAFSEELRVKFGDPFDTKTAYNRLTALRQNASARDYAIKFRELASRAGLPEPLQMIQYESNLKLDVQNSLVGHKYDNLNDLINQSVEIDDKLFANNRAGRTQVKTTTTTTRISPSGQASEPNASGSANNAGSQASSSSQYTPMDVDSIRSGPRGPLTPEERQRRMTKGLCLVCASPDHRAKDCPQSRENRNRNGQRQILAITDGTTDGVETSFPVASSASSGEQ